MTKRVMQLKSVNKSYGNHHVLKEINLSVDEGEVVVILGPSGSGKSTLLRCMNGLEPINSGEIIFKDQAVTQTEKVWQKLRQKIGMVFQSYDLFPNKTVLENCVFAPVKVKGEARDKVTALAQSLLKKVGLEDYQDRMPSQLSGGQKQRVAIVRCLCMAPELILLDEITASLDPEMVNEVLRVILTLAEERRTMVVVTHEMVFAKAVADRVVFMDDGQIVEITPTRDFFSAPKSERARQFLSSLDFEQVLQEEE